jgi:hypothetical protein
MALVVPRVGLWRMLAQLVNQEMSENLVLHLYQNDHKPQRDDLLDAYQEADFIGYEPIVLAGGNWTIRQAERTAPAEVTHPYLTFTATTDQPEQVVYGYYLTDELSGALKWAERFPGEPFLVWREGQEIWVAPALTLAF